MSSRSLHVDAWQTLNAHHAITCTHISQSSTLDPVYTPQHVYASGGGTLGKYTVIVRLTGYNSRQHYTGYKPMPKSGSTNHKDTSTLARQRAEYLPTIISPMQACVSTLAWGLGPSGVCDSLILHRYGCTLCIITQMSRKQFPHCTSTQMDQGQHLVFQDMLHSRRPEG